MANVICPILLDTVVKGDHRVHSANIIWVVADSNSWVRNSCNTLKGEIALEVVIEKNSVQKNGVAWQTIFDACLPVFHLVDSRRSIPYGIQQIQELLGISCAFDQSVQRLSTSIRAVAKGVLKEHLILVANSMTCTGSLLGFNKGGFKALFRSLKVQAPFTEATLLTPMKCFEIAAEKSHSDLLGSIVSSCSWGKHVAVGTGTNFQILWDNQQIADNEVRKDVYGFLDMVRITSGEMEVTEACFGTDVDDLEEENENNGVCLSPETNMAFEDDATFGDNMKVEGTCADKKSFKNWETTKSRWDDIASPKCDFGSSHGWERLDKSVSSVHKPGVWSSWDVDKVQRQPIESSKLDVEHDGFCTWDSVQVKKTGCLSGQSDAWNEFVTHGNVDKPEKLSIWDAKPTSSAEKHISDDSSFSKLDAGGHESTNPVDSTKSFGDTSKKPEKGTRASDEVQDGWGQRGVKDHERPSTIERWKENRANDRGDQGWRSQGWGSSNYADPASQKNHSSRSPVTADDWKGWNTNKAFNFKGRRSESFTPEEEKILVDVEPIMHSLRKILHDSSDGSRLSPEDQSFIMENVFKHHPDKQAKVTNRIDYIMVDKHESFKDSRCFYVVSCDGSSVDFSYLKCMENFVKENYPEHAESFNKKYFRRRRAENRSDRQDQQQ